MNCIVSLLQKTASKPWIFILLGMFISVNLLFNLPGLPTSIPSLQKISPTFKPFDLQSNGYNRASFIGDLDGLGEEGRMLYRNFMLCDLFYPVIYALTLASLIFLGIGKQTRGLRWLLLIPFATALVDYVENVCVTLSFIRYPDLSSNTVSIASVATQSKTFLIYALILALIISLGFWIKAFFWKSRA